MSFSSPSKRSSRKKRRRRSKRRSRTRRSRTRRSRTRRRSKRRRSKRRRRYRIHPFNGFDVLFKSHDRNFKMAPSVRPLRKGEETNFVPDASIPTRKTGAFDSASGDRFVGHAEEIRDFDRYPLATNYLYERGLATSGNVDLNRDWEPNQDQKVTYAFRVPFYDRFERLAKEQSRRNQNVRQRDLAWVASKNPAGNQYRDTVSSYYR